MGTIVDKINYLKQTKSSIYNAIKSKGSNISESTTFRQYADKISELDVSGGSTSNFLNYLDRRKKEILDELDIKEPTLPSQYVKLKEFVLNRPETITYDYCYGFCTPFKASLDFFSNLDPDKFSDYKLYDSDYGEIDFTINQNSSYIPNYSKCITINGIDYCYVLLGFNKKDTSTNLGDLFFCKGYTRYDKFGLFIDIPNGLVFDKDIERLKLYNCIYFDISTNTPLDIEEVVSTKDLYLCDGYFGEFEPTFLKRFNFDKVFTYRPGKSIYLFSSNSEQNVSKINYLELPEISIPKDCNLNINSPNVKKVVCSKLTVLNSARKFDIIYKPDFITNNYIFEGDIIMPNTNQLYNDHEILRGCKYLKGNLLSGPVIYSDYNYNYTISSDLEFIDGNLTIDMRNTDGSRLEKELSINLNQRYIKNLSIYSSYKLSLKFENKNGNILIDNLLIDLLNTKTDRNYDSSITANSSSVVDKFNLNIIGSNSGKSPKFNIDNNFYPIDICNINFKNYLPTISKSIFNNPKSIISILFEDSFPKLGSSYTFITELGTSQDIICNANVVIDNKSTNFTETYVGFRHINGSLTFNTVADSEITNIPIYIGDNGSCKIKCNKIGSLNFSNQSFPYLDDSNWQNFKFINDVSITQNRDIEFKCSSSNPIDLRPIITGNYTLTIKSIGTNVYNLFKLGANNKNVKFNQSYCLDVYNKLAELADTLPSGSSNKIVINSSDYDYYSSNLAGAGSWITTFRNKNWTISK